jgi:hypothetical protein
VTWTWINIESMYLWIGIIIIIIIIIVEDVTVKYRIVYGAPQCFKFIDLNSTDPYNGIRYALDIHTLASILRGYATHSTYTH